AAPARRVRWRRRWGVRRAGPPDSSRHGSCGRWNDAPVSALRDAAAVVYGLGWELRRRLYARGALQPSRVPARVVSIGNLTVGGTGKTTLALHLGRWLRDRGADVAVVCRRYRPGPRGTGDEEQMFVDAIDPERVHAGTRKC